jgi:hypothetical protein
MTEINQHRFQALGWNDKGSRRALYALRSGLVNSVRAR